MMKLFSLLDVSLKIIQDSVVSNIPFSTKVTVPNLGVRMIVCLIPPTPILVSSNLFNVPLYWSLAAVLR